MSSCSFTAVCDVHDGGVVLSLNDPSSSLAASNTSFTGCCRTRNVAVNGTEVEKKQPGRQNTTDNGANLFSWCEENESKTTGTSDSISDGVSSGGAMCMNNLESGELSVSHCLFNNCFVFSRGGGIMCHTIKSVHIENDVFGACTAQNQYGGGFYVVTISSCVRIGGCEFQKCPAQGWGGGVDLDRFHISGSGCAEAENQREGSGCVFECSFAWCSISSLYGGGLHTHGVPEAFKMSGIQFVSCSANSYGGGIDFYPLQQTVLNSNFYFYF
ncbi:uncharacterized protein MONOS_15582 [Monocercomonoides exilis]|uniref:uncharacterized protein n=1 Tax=Monocercomonoides exilis TaxID=2049356 RepID=UPI00355A9366|nr:hypothetical protein MONOS_15582 [Monocercomonoides exilis]|eukprot:MONOS_15582.1-p1 / transcript=MONOS_15582.1 / gene=MONOS_15582 / organism=Monocercomonoides_exilis_PA203 / gene_product=unspecified product / transcript_product=unspecified product / location=Mono_scaffold01280:3314-4126(-) / protein_length=271 / sequence_SO=supercontig / SO=protein_coding / is_pseudo=false